MAASSELSGVSREATPVGIPTVFSFSLPVIGVNFSLVLTIASTAKYSVDVLLVAPAVIGLIFGLSRVWDAVTDPLIGYLSDKTQGRFGRRRPWMLSAAIPDHALRFGP